MGHELDKLDRHLGLPIGTTRDVIVSHKTPVLLNEQLVKYGIILDEDGMVPKDQIRKWRDLMMSVGIGRRYWKDKDLLFPDNIPTIASLPETTWD